MCHSRCTYRVPVRLWSLAAAEVAQSPGGIAQHTQLAAVAEEVQQRLQRTTAQHVVTALGAVTSNVSESPDGLLTHVGLRTGKKFNKDRDGTSLDDDLCLGGAT